MSGPTGVSRWRKKGRDLNVTLMSLRYMCQANPAETLIHGSNEENQENPYSKGSVHICRLTRSRQ